MPERWPTSGVVLHWLVALLVVLLAIGGFVMADLPPESTARLWVSRMHSVGGLTVVLLTLARLAVRARGARPAPLPLGEAHRRGVAAVHGLIIATTLGVGLTGAVTAARSAWPEYVGGALAAAPDLHELPSREAHETLVLALLALVVLHVGGVMLQEGRGKRILRRMLPLLP